MKTLLTAQQIQSSVQSLGSAIADHYRDRDAPLLIIGVLTGSIIFLADLIRQIDVPHQIGMIDASSYRGETTKSCRLEINLEMLPEVSGRDVLLVDDIFDTGKTIDKLAQELKILNPESVKTAVLLRKLDCSQVAAKPDYTAFEIENEFVVGYGLDYNDDYRHLPYIAVLPS